MNKGGREGRRDGGTEGGREGGRDSKKLKGSLVSRLPPPTGWAKAGGSLGSEIM